MTKMVNALSFTAKLCILGIVPTLLFIILSASSLHDIYNEKSELIYAKTEVELAQFADSIAHQHAVERGLTAGFLSSRAQQDKTKLIAQRNKSDQSWEDFLAFTQNHPELEKNPLIGRYLSNIETHLTKKSQIRASVDALSSSDALTSSKEVFYYYSRLNQLSLDLIEVLGAAIPNGSTAQNFVSFHRLLTVKEDSGKVRGNLNGVFKSQHLGLDTLAALQGAIRTIQNNLVKATEQAHPSIQTEINDALSTENYRAIQAIHTTLLGHSPSIDQVSQSDQDRWFTLATHAIQNIKSISDQAYTNIQHEIDDNIATLSNTFIFLMFVAVMLGTCIAAFVLWQIKDLKTRIYALQHVLHAVFIEGDLTKRVPETHSDEIGQISISLNELLNYLQQLVADIKNIGQSLNEHSDNIYSSSEKNYSSIDKQSEQIQLMASAITEMSASFAEVAQSTNNAENASTSAQNSSHQGLSNVEETGASVKKLSLEIEHAAKDIHEVTSSCNNISGILGTIRAIAEQTNLLALNAAIEAARAGEQGRGFAVVADEVRSLAQRTQESTEEIDHMISALQHSTSNAKNTMSTSQKVAEQCLDYSVNSGESMKHVDQAINEVHELSIQIAAATEEQTAVSSEISQNIVNISDNADEVLNVAEHVKDSGISLKRIAEKLNEKVMRYKA